jgi:uncharacterized protein (DUF427 family)
MKATWRGEVIANSDQTREVGGYIYFPRDTVRMDRLKAADKIDSDHACPHGVRFYDVVGVDAVSRRAAWSYEAPRESMQQVDHWVGFWEDVTVS